MSNLLSPYFHKRRNGEATPYPGMSLMIMRLISGFQILATTEHSSIPVTYQRLEILKMYR